MLSILNEIDPCFVTSAVCFVRDTKQIFQQINHLDSLPLKVGISKKYFNGPILTTTHIWKGKIMCLNFCMVHMRAKHDFSIGVYLVL